MMLIDDKGNKITYSAFENICEKEEQLLESGTLAFLFCRNSVGSVLYYRICLRKHVVPLLLEHQMDEELLKVLLETYEPEYLIGMPEDLKKAGSDGAVMGGSECFGYRIKKRAEETYKTAPGSGTSSHNIRKYGKSETGKTESEECLCKRGVDRRISETGCIGAADHDTSDELHIWAFDHEQPF